MTALVQWESLPNTPGETSGKGWTLHPDFRVKAGDLPVGAGLPNAFSHTDLAAELHARAVHELVPMALPDVNWPPPPRPRKPLGSPYAFRTP
ncbi:isochorismatase [Deinococcus saxicola]|uniref:isochorismatase n=1 Tax=Deinococcus saxicola TaxID=249406 RepID=UPI0039EE76DE